MKLFPKSAWALATVLACGSICSAAGPLDDRIPQESILYVGWAGSDALAPQYANSNLKGVVDATGARAFINQHLPKLIEMAGQQDPQAPQIIAKLQTGLGIAWRHPSAFYFCPVNFTNPQQPELRMGLVVDAGTEAKALSELMTEALAKVPTTPDVPQVKLTTEGNIVTLTFGKADTAADRARGGGLAAVPAYTKAMGQTKIAKPAVAFYLDAAKLIAMVNDGIAKMPAPPEVKTQAPLVIDALGLNGLTQAASASGFDGKEWSEQFFVGMNGPRQGLLTLIPAAPLSDNVLSAVPRDAVSLATAKVDPKLILGEFRNLVRKIDPGALQSFERDLAGAGKEIGMDIEQDALAPLGDEWVFYRAPLSDVGGYSPVLVQKARDGEKLARTVTQIEALVNAAGQGQFKIDRVTASKIEFSSVSFLQYSLAWTVRNGYLYVSTVDGLPGAVKQVENKLPSIAENDNFKKAMATLPQGIKPLSISYSNPAKTYPEIRRLGLGLLPVARAAGVDLPTSLLPDVDDLSAFLTPGASVSWADNDGFHMAGRTAFPGAEMLGGIPGGQAGVATAAMGAGLALPAIAQARNTAKRTADASSLKQIALVSHMHAAENNGRFPDGLDRLVAGNTLDPRLLTSPLSGRAPLQMDADLRKLAADDFASFSKTIAAHSDYAYIGSQMSVTTPNTASLILAYDKPSPALRDGMNVAFLDGHIEFVRWQSLDATFAVTNDYLKSKGLPAIDTKELIEKAGAKQNP